MRRRRRRSSRPFVDGPGVPDAPDWRVEAIRREHGREAFDCGTASLNDFLRKFARQNEDLAVARTFVAVKPADLEVRGYYTLRTGQVEIERIPPEETKRLPRYPVPVVHLARLAVDKRAQGRRLGEFLLVDALERSLRVSRSVAAYAVEVLAIDDSARRFYLRYGFQELLDDRLHLYLPMRTVSKLFEERG